MVMNIITYVFFFYIKNEEGFQITSHSSIYNLQDYTEEMNKSQSEC